MRLVFMIVKFRHNFQEYDIGNGEGQNILLYHDEQWPSVYSGDRANLVSFPLHTHIVLSLGPLIHCGVGPRDITKPVYTYRSIRNGEIPVSFNFL